MTDKYDILRQNRTCAPNFDLDTEAIISQLQRWDAAYGIELGETGHDRVLVRFQTLPEDTGDVAREIYAFCPDTVDQHYGCIHELAESLEESGMELPDHIRDLIEGVDLSDPDYGVVLLGRGLKRDHALSLWWD